MSNPQNDVLSQLNAVTQEGAKIKKGKKKDFDYLKTRTDWIVQNMGEIASMMKDKEYPESQRVEIGKLVLKAVEIAKAVETTFKGF